MSTTLKQDEYRLMRDSVSSVRLNAQHYIWKQACGFNLHPQIPLPEDREIKIADVATGTGIWMLELKQSNHQLQLDGFDRSLEQCPPIKICPEGCSIRQLDILDDVPADLKNVYDVVHVRLIQAGLDNDPTVALRNLITMLKPGGHLQWQEINLSAVAIASVDPTLDQTSMESLVEVLHRFPYGAWTCRLADICSEVGLLDAKTDKYHVRPEFSIPFCQTQFMVYEEFSKVGMDNNGSDSEGPKFRALIERAYSELNTGVWLDHSLEVTVARKPD